MFQQTQKLGFLGMMIDFITMKLQVPGENIKIRLEARSLLRPLTTTARGVYKLWGKCRQCHSDSPYPTFLQILQRDLPNSLLEGQYRTTSPNTPVIEGSSRDGMMDQTSLEGQMSVVPTVQPVNRI